MHFYFFTNIWKLVHIRSDSFEIFHIHNLVETLWFATKNE